MIRRELVVGRIHQLTICNANLSLLNLRFTSIKSFNVLYSFLGEFCEVRMETPCRDKYFGPSSIDVCGPCKCEVEMNLSPVCNNSRGERYCNVSTKWKKLIR